MINFDDYANENKNEHNKNLPHIPDHTYRILNVGGSGSGKTNVLLKLIENQPDVEKIYLYAKDPYEAKCWYSIKTRRKLGIDNHNDQMSIQIICAMFTKILIFTIPIKKIKY